MYFHLTRWYTSLPRSKTAARSRSLWDPNTLPSHNSPLDSRKDAELSVYALATPIIIENYVKVTLFHEKKASHGTTENIIPFMKKQGWIFIR